MLRPLEILGIVLLRFKAVPRAWVIVLILVNLGSLLFLHTHYGLANLLAVLAGIIIMALIYGRLGFVRLLGIRPYSLGSDAGLVSVRSSRQGARSCTLLLGIEFNSVQFNFSRD